MPKPIISVVIPAYNEEKEIKSCLGTIFRQDFPTSSFEVIVVDNNSTDKTASIVKRSFPQVRIIKEIQPGAVFARIRGVEEAKGKIIAMTDADTLVPPFWLKKLMRAYEDPKAVAVAGTSDFAYKNSFIRFCQFFINHFNLFFRTFPGYNMSFKKDAYYQVGGFSTKINLCEDFYLSVKIKKAGKTIVLPDNPVLTSSRRFFEGFFSYASKYIINVFTILIFDKPVFFKFKAVREKAEATLNYLKDEYR
jgi:glycosyltransferase involved in cell wall biosynthesis